ncbi:MAG: helix-turn-helix transcriptional regulator [Enhydrobacter sp.]|nr:helix-turn-helix transcriptional regulator [Enhydrobacter sp.]
MPREIAGVDWLLRGATEERPVRLGERVEIDDASWCATIERIQIRPGLRVFLTDAHVHKDVTIEPRDNRDDEWMASQIGLAGRAEIDFLDGRHSYTSTDQTVLFRAPRRNAAFAIAAGTHYRSVGYGLEIGDIVRLFDGDVPPALHELVEPNIEQSRVLALRTDRSIRTLARAIFANDLNGPLRRLMMEATVLQLLAWQAIIAQRQRSPRPAERLWSAADREALHAARHRLLADMRQPPTLEELATETGLSEKRLNDGFKLFFGTTVFETLRNERLEHARIVLLSDTVGLKEVAFRVGYNHVTNFVTAFTRRYGAPPRQYSEQSTLGADLVPSGTVLPLRRSGASSVPGGRAEDET